MSSLEFTKTGLALGTNNSLREGESAREREPIIIHALQSPSGASHPTATIPCHNFFPNKKTIIALLGCSGYVFT